MLKQSFKLFKLAFKSEKSNYKLLIITVILELIAIGILYNLNAQYGYLYQGIQDYNKDLIWKSIGLFASLAFVLVIIGGFITFYANKLAFTIRQGLTGYFIGKLYEVCSKDNIEQRIQEDLRNFGRLSVDFWLAILKAVIKLPLFLSVIITLTDWYVGLIVLLAVVLGTLATKIFANKLIALQVTQEGNEAEFRKAIRNNTLISNTWCDILTTFGKINTQLKKLTFLQSGLGQGFVLLPFIILLPLYIAKTITMGAFFQSVNALAKVIDSLTILIDSRQLIADVTTCLTRVTALQETLKED